MLMIWGLAVLYTEQERRRIIIIVYCLYTEMSAFYGRKRYEAIVMLTMMIMLLTVAVGGNQI